ncbi:MAG: NADH-quinone oxidoreductase subunit M [Bdellovibrionota bacterium]
MADFISHYILSILIFFPLVAAGVIFLIPSKETSQVHRNIAMIAVVVEFILSLHLIRYFFSGSSFFQFAQFIPWLPKVTGVNYIVGVDGLSLSLVLLSTTFCMFGVMTSYTTIKVRSKAFLILFLMLESTIIGVFTSLDVVLFYVFWEASLIPVYFMIGIWGGKQRIHATLKFFIYGVAGSLLMLVALIYLYYVHGKGTGIYSSNILDLYSTAANLPFPVQSWLFLAVTLSFGIKVPIFPFYSWLPDAYEQSPAIYTIMSGVILKLAAYGLIRFSVCLFPQAASHYATAIMILAVIGILYGALIAWQQTNIRRIMAFSSLSHLGFIVLGIFAFNQFSLQGALYQMLNHAITAGALFILFNFLYERRKSFDINDFGGLASTMPWFSLFFIIACMGAVALPSTGSFVGEWLILMGAFQAAPIIASIATLGVILGAVYILWIAYKVIFGTAKYSENVHVVKLRNYEVFQLVVLSGFIFVLGFAATPIMEHTQTTLLRIEKTAIQKISYESRLVQSVHGRLVPIQLSSDAAQGDK